MYKFKRFPDYINILMQFLLLYMVSVYFQVLFHILFKLDIDMKTPVFIIGVLIIIYIIRKKCNNFILYLLIHILLLFLSISLIKLNFLKVHFAIIIIGIWYYSYKFWRDKLEERNPKLTTQFSLSLEIIFLFMAFHMSILKFDNKYINLNYYISLLYIILYFLKFYLINLEMLLSGNKKTTPVKRIFKMSNGVMGIVFSVFMVGIVFLDTIGIDKVLMNVCMFAKTKIFIFLRWLLNGTSIDENVPYTPDYSGQMLKSIGTNIPNRPINSWLEKFLEILDMFGQIFIVVFIFVLLIVFIYTFFKNNMKKQIMENNEVEDIIEKIEVSQKIKDDLKQNMFKYIFSKTNNQRIREIYKKRVLKNSKNGIKVKKSFTPNQIEEYILKNDREITQIYEKARYSQRECTKEDLNRLK